MWQLPSFGRDELLSRKRSAERGSRPQQCCLSLYLSLWAPEALEQILYWVLLDTRCWPRAETVQEDEGAMLSMNQGPVLLPTVMLPEAESPFV
jgi:hypothetical protein